MRTIIAGGRDFSDFKLLCSTLSEQKVSLVVSGCARGADRLGEKWAAGVGIPISRFPAEWDTHGKSAGYIRNTAMAENADVLVAFWDGNSRGTKHMIDVATKKKLQVTVVLYGADPLI